ncbi:hypothetical protein AAH084_09885 [Bacteroides faecis]|uniref:hypothetical protein n=1 Tax=Bacteroides faecis TaxID=674529 RepID=UPI0039B4370C
MNKILYSLIISIFIFVFVGCETDGEDMDMGFVVCNVSFVQKDIQNSYEVYYDGEKSINPSMPVKRNSPFKLEVYKVGENQPELSQEITLDNSKNIELLKLVGRDIAISSSLKEYTTFTPIISYSDPNTDLYTVTFNNGVLSNKVKNYIAEADLSGTLKIVRNADGQVLYEQDMTIMPEGQFSLMQLSDTDFLEMSDGEEPDPDPRQYTKIRFFYTADAFPGHDKLQLIVYLMDLDAMQFTDPIATIDLEAGKISEYIQIDNDTFGQGVVNGVYDLIDENGNMIVNNMEHLNTSIRIGTSDNKFMTFRFMDPSHQGGDNVQCPSILSTPWE